MHLGCVCSHCRPGSNGQCSCPQREAENHSVLSSFGLAAIIAVACSVALGKVAPDRSFPTPLLKEASAALQTDYANAAANLETFYPVNTYALSSAYVATSGIVSGRALTELKAESQRDNVSKD